MKPSDSFFTISPLQFEQYVHALLTNLGKDLSGFRTEHRIKRLGLDGEYEIDIEARFQAMGAEFNVLVECKCHRHSIKRDIVQVLNDRIRSLGAHKGMIFATANYQKGAIDYAARHGIALIRVTYDELYWETRRRILITKKKPLLPLTSWIVHSDPENRSPTILDKDLSRLTNLIFQTP